jgi:N-acetylglucosaminyl-diphospho-decaprenol L-rhamnosyltransferase
MSERPPLALVVVSWESRQDLSRLLDSMLAHLDPAAELIVVDNASSDPPGRELERWPGPTRFERLERNLGFGAACNRGVEHAAAETIVLANPDLELIDGSLSALAQEALRTQGLVGPRLLEPDRSEQPSASGPVVGIWPWVGALWPGALQPAAIRARTEPWRLRGRTPVCWLTGACIAAPRTVLSRLGPFDPAIELMSEDLDLCLRAALQGVPVVFAPETCRLVHHAGGARRRRFDDAGLALAARNRRAAIARAYGPARERRAWRAHLLRLRLRAGAKRILGRPADGELAELAAAARFRGYC